MAARRYLLILATGFTLACAGVAFFNMLIDPLGISPLRITLASINAAKPLRAQHDRIVKRFDVLRSQPRTIFVGTSRIKQTFDPSKIADTAFAPAYNAGIDNGDNYGEIYSFLESWFQSDANVRQVFIEVFMTATLSIRDHRGRERWGVARSAVDYKNILFSRRGVEYSLETIAVNRRLAGDNKASPRDDGYFPITLAPHHFSVRNVLNHVLHYRILRREARVPIEFFSAAKDISTLCRAHKVDCRFVFTPLHADVLYGLYHLDLWSEVEELKRRLVAIAPVHDFTRYSALIDERRGPVVYWPEAFHYSPALGDLISDVLMRQRVDGLPANFGRQLDALSIEDDLRAWRRERDEWIAANPEIRRRFEAAEAAYMKGISFKQVTDEAYQAGDW